MAEPTEEIVAPAPPEKFKDATIADHARRMIELLGEDPNREGLRNTPERFEKAMRFLTRGYEQDLDKVLNGAMFSVCWW